MARLSKTDLEQMGEAYFRSLPPEILLEVTKNLYELAVEQLERLEKTSKTSSRPPSSDSPYAKAKPLAHEESPPVAPPTPEGEHPDTETEIGQRESTSVSDIETAQASSSPGKRKAGKQPGSPGKWRTQPLKSELTINHHPQQCSACNAQLSDEHQDAKAYMGYYQLELKPHEHGFKIECHLHHYYGATCSCGHHSRGYLKVSVLKWKDEKSSCNCENTPWSGRCWRVLSPAYRFAIDFLGPRSRSFYEIGRG